AGEAAFGTVLQSVGGSGGFAGAGSGFSITPLIPLGKRVRLVAGDQYHNASGSGGAVQFNDTGSIQIATAGNNAVAVLAQSVGGGGGIVANAQSQLHGEDGVDASINPTHATDTLSDGGAVTVNLGGS